MKTKLSSRNDSNCRVWRVLAPRRAVSALFAAAAIVALTGTAANATTEPTTTYPAVELVPSGAAGPPCFGAPADQVIAAIFAGVCGSYST